MEGLNHEIDRLLEIDIRLNLPDQRDERVVLVNIFELQELAPEVVIFVEDREILANRRDQIVIHSDRDVVPEKRCMEGGRVVANLCGKNVRWNGRSQRGGQAKFVILEFLVELMKGPPTQIPVLF